MSLSNSQPPSASSPTQMSSPETNQELLEASGVTTFGEGRLEALFREASGIELNYLPGGFTRRSAFTLKQLSRKSKLVRTKVKTRRKVTKATKRRKKTIRKQALAKRARLWRDSSFRYWQVKFGDRWQITPEEWADIWDRFDLEGISPWVSPVRPGALLDKWGIVIRPEMEKRLRSAIVYDGDDEKLYSLMKL